MKKTIISLLLMAGVAMGATSNTDTYIITFGGNNGENLETPQTASSLTYNLISTSSSYNNTSGSGYIGSSLTATDGHTTSTFGFDTRGSLSGGNGQITGFGGDATTITTVFQGAPILGSITKPGGFKFTSAGAGSYTIYALAARGNKWDNSDTNYIKYSLNGIDTATASIVSYNVSQGVNAPSLNTDKTAITALSNGANKNATDWVLMKFKFELSETKDIWVDNVGGNSNFAGFVVEHTYSTPEPTTATLSLLALAGLAARRRRK